MSTTDGGPAFPVAEVFDERRGGYMQYGSYGMTLRDYFAAQMLSGIAYHAGEGCDGYIEQRVRVAYAIADAILKERAK